MHTCPKRFNLVFALHTQNMARMLPTMQCLPCCACSQPQILGQLALDRPLQNSIVITRHTEGQLTLTSRGAAQVGPHGKVNNVSYDVCYAVNGLVRSGVCRCAITCDELLQGKAIKLRA
jgi:hypothetical protein